MNDKIQKVAGLVATGKFWKEVVIMTLGMLVAAAAVYYFLVPSKLIIGTISGLSIVLSGICEAFFGIEIKVSLFVVIINAGKVALTGNKRQTKVAYRHSGYPGGLRAINVGDELKTRPDRVIERAVKGMLPHNSLGRQMLSKLKVYAGPEHPHAAQQPQTFEIKQVAQ